MNLRRIFCLLGIHDWSHDAKDVSPLLSTGSDCNLHPNALQTGVRSCEREGCERLQDVFRRVWAYKRKYHEEEWQPLSPRKREKIESLSVFTASVCSHH